MSDQATLLALLDEVKSLGRRYFVETGRPLGVTGEVAELEAIRLMDLTLAPVRQSGWDATGKSSTGGTERLQIKGRCISGKLKPGARMGRIDTTKEWDAVLLVLMRELFVPSVIYRAERIAILAALEAPGSRARNERGQLAISKFKAIGKQVWPTNGA